MTKTTLRPLQWTMSDSAWTATTKYHRQGDLNNRYLCSFNSGGSEVWDQCASRHDSQWELFSWHVHGCLLAESPHDGWKRKACSLVLSVCLFFSFFFVSFFPPPPLPPLPPPPFFFLVYLTLSITLLSGIHLSD